MRKLMMATAALVAGTTFAFANGGGLPAKEFVADFGGGKCGILDLTGSQPTYEYGNCELGQIVGTPEYTARRVTVTAQDKGYLVKVDDATYEIRLAADKILVGKWTLGAYVNNSLTFKAA